MKVFVTGGTGKIGSALVAELMSRGAEVTALCRTKRAADLVTGTGSGVIRGDLRSPIDWCGKVTGFDAVIHVACTFDTDMPRIDKCVTQALLQALDSNSRHRRRLIYTGGVWCWGNADGGSISEASPFDPVPEFAWCLANSRSVLTASHTDGMVIHPALVVDRHIHQGLPDILVAENVGTDCLHVPASAETRWPLVDVADLAKAYCAALERGTGGAEYLIASEAGVPMKDIARLATSFLGVRGPVVYEPPAYWQCRYGAWTAGYLRDQVISSGKAQLQLGWRPEFRLQLS